MHTRKRLTLVPTHTLDDALSKSFIFLRYSWVSKNALLLSILMSELHGKFFKRASTVICSPKFHSQYNCADRQHAEPSTAVCFREFGCLQKVPDLVQ